MKTDFLKVIDKMANNGSHGRHGYGNFQLEQGSDWYPQK